MMLGNVREACLGTMGLVRDDGYEKVAALRAIAAMLELARTGATDVDATTLAEAIAAAETVALNHIRRFEH